MGTKSLTQLGLGSADLTAIGKLSETGLSQVEIADAVVEGDKLKKGNIPAGQVGAYTKAEVDGIIDNIPETDLSGYYNKTEVDTKIADIPPPDLTNYYNKTQVDSLIPDINTKQDTLISATNIKTINGESVLGSGDLVISGDGVGTGGHGLSAYELYVKNLPESDTPLSEIEWLDSLKAETTVSLDDMTPEQLESIRGVQGPAGPTGAGIQIDGIYPDEESVMVAINNGIIKDRNVVLVEDREVLTNTTTYDYFISPDGDDVVGDGSIQYPWKTIANCPRYSRIGLMDGVYDDKDYGQIKVDQYGGIHGLFANLGSSVSDNPFILTETTKEIAGAPYTSIPVDTPATLIGAVNPGNVVIKMGTTAHRDYPAVDGTQVSSVFNKLFMVKDVIFDMSRGKSASYSASIARHTRNQGVLLDCQFNETGTYSTAYDYYNANNYPLYINCKFKGNRLPNHQGRLSIVMDNEVIPLDYDTGLYDLRVYDNTLMIYNQAKSHLTPLVSADAMMLLRGRDGEVKVKWEDLTPKQLDSLKKGPKGDNGKSTYDIAVENGYMHSVTQWLKDIGPLDMYQTYLRNTTDEPKLEYNDWLDSMKIRGDMGPAGRPGRDGTVAFELLTEIQRESLKGESQLTYMESGNLIKENIDEYSLIINKPLAFNAFDKETYNIYGTGDNKIKIKPTKLVETTPVDTDEYQVVEVDVRNDPFKDSSVVSRHALESNLLPSVGGSSIDTLNNTTFSFKEDGGVKYLNTVLAASAAYMKTSEINVGASFTINFKFKPSGTTNAGILHFKNVEIVIWGTKIGYVLGSGLKSTPIIPVANTWYDITITVDGSDSKIYIDGELTTTGGGGGYSIVNTNYIGMFGRSYNKSSPFVGGIRDIRIINRAITDEEAMVLFKDKPYQNIVLYHGLGEVATKATINHHTINLKAPAFKSADDARNYGLKVGDIYIEVDTLKVLLPK